LTFVLWIGLPAALLLALLAFVGPSRDLAYLTAVALLPAALTWYGAFVYNSEEDAMDEERVVRTCEVCGRRFDHGYDGILVCPEQGKYIDVCDDCAGVERDEDGNITNVADVRTPWVGAR